MPRMAPKSVKVARAIIDEELPQELSFDDDDSSDGRAGDLRPEQDILDEFPPERVRQAGMTGGEVPEAGPDSGVTADDLAPETLLDDNRSHSPAAHRRRDAADTLLSSADERDIGAGGGLDEAELAREQPLDPAEWRKQKRTVQRHNGTGPEHKKAQRPTRAN